MEKREVITYIAEKLKSYGATVLDYNGDSFIGIRNPNSTLDMAFAFYDEVFTVEFAFQAARFSYDDYKDAPIYAEKLLTGKTVAVELFMQGKPIFGGTRETPDISRISDKVGFAKWYACGNETAETNILKFLSGESVSAQIFGWKESYEIKF